jgi:hypothetical protein
MWLGAARVGRCDASGWVGGFGECVGALTCAHAGGGVLQHVSSCTGHHFFVFWWPADNEIGAAGATAIASALKVNTAITKLRLSGGLWHQSAADGDWFWCGHPGHAGLPRRADNRTGAEGATSIAEALKANTTVRALDMGGA